jgi:hypothetical protein
MNECYKLTCHACGEDVVLAPVDGGTTCPLCRTPLLLHWRAEHSEDTEKPSKFAKVYASAGNGRRMSGFMGIGRGDGLSCR